jgi:amylosucrase
MAIDRILMLYTIVFTIGGLPLIYLGDEIGMLNDYSYRNDPAKQDDSRWVHRTSLAKEKLERRKTEGTIEGRIFARFQEIIRIRKSHRVFSGSDPKGVFSDNDHIFAYQRTDEKDTCIVMANFADSPQSFDLAGMGGKSGKDCLCGESVMLDGTITMHPYQVRIVNL